MLFHEILKTILKSIRKHDFYYISNIPDIDGNCIYAVNHSCRWDTQYMMEVLAYPTYQGCYLETNKECNISMYEHFGFKLMERGKIPGTDVEHIAMYREPRGNNG